MNTKKILVYVLTIVSILFLVMNASAYTITGDLANTSTSEVEIDGLSASLPSDISVIAGETLDVKVSFESLEDTSNVRIEVEIDGEKQDVSEKTGYFDVEAGMRYSKKLSIKVPYELKEETSRDLNFNIRIWNADYKSEIEDITLRVQRPTYQARILSVTTSDNVKAGEMIPVDVVLKNKGYNNLDDVYVTVRISELNVEKTSYFGNLVSLEDDNDETDTVSGRFYLQVPYEAAEGIYTIEVEVLNDDTESSETAEIFVENDFPETVIQTASGLLIINPTNELRIYRVVLPSGENLVSVQSGSSKTVNVNSDSEEYAVSVLTMDGKLVSSFSFSRGAENISSPIVVFTVILGIVFLVLLVVLIVLITKKPEKTEEFGESYY